MNKLPSIGSLFDKTWQTYHENFWTFAKISSWIFLTAIFGTIGYLLIPSYATPSFLTSTAVEFTPTAVAGTALLGFNVLILLPVLTIWITIGLTLAIKKIHAGEKIEIDSLLASAWGFFPGYLGASILYGLALTIPTLVVGFLPGYLALRLGGRFGSILGFGGLFLLAAGMVAAIVFVLVFGLRAKLYNIVYLVEQTSVVESIKRSLEITKGHFLALFLRVALAFAAFSILAIALRLVLFGVGVGILEPLSSKPALLAQLSVTVDLIFTGLYTVITLPLVTTFFYHLYEQFALKK